MSSVPDILEDLRKRYEKASFEMLRLHSYESWGVSSRLAKELGMLQIVKKANTIDNLIQKQVEQLQAALGLEGGDRVSETRQKVIAARERVFRRMLAHFDTAIGAIMASKMYKLSSDEARALKIQQRNASASKIVQELVALRERVKDKLTEKEHRVGKINLSPTFASFRSRSRSSRSRSSQSSPRRSRSRSSRSRSSQSSPRRSRSLSSRSLSSRSRSRSPSAQRMQVGRMTFVMRKPSSRSRSRSPTSMDLERFHHRSQLTSAEKADVMRQYPLATQRARMNYPF